MDLPDTTGWSINQRLEWLRNCTPQQWDSICRRCGACCLKKLDAYEVMGIRGVLYTHCACSHLNVKTRQCNIYQDRLARPDSLCKKVDLDAVLNGNMLPDSCGYREFIYGPARFPANIDWSMVQNTPDDYADISRMFFNTIPGSYMWCNHCR